MDRLVSKGRENGCTAPLKHCSGLVKAESETLNSTPKPRQFDLVTTMPMKVFDDQSLTLSAAGLGTERERERARERARERHPKP